MGSKEIIKTCHWEITRRCNLNCLHCISSVGNRRKELDKESALKVIDILKDWGCEEINFTGGEPLFRQNIFDILEKAKQNKIKVNLLSNGTLINSRNVKQIKNYVDEIGISLDGASSEINDAIRGDGSFKKIVNAISLVKKHKIPTSLYITICKLNINDFENILRLTKFLNINNVRANEITLRGRAFRNKKILGFNKSDKSNLEKYLLDILKKISCQDKDFLFDDSCEIDAKNIFISPSGYIYPCIEIYQRKPYCHFGNILRVNKEDFRLQKNQQIKSKPQSCPYQLIVKDNFALCLNKPSTKCNYEC